MHRTQHATICKSGVIQREVLSREQRVKLDNVDDRNFYEFPRFVKHVDESFISTVTSLYRCSSQHTEFCTVLLFQPEYRSGHSEIYLFSLPKKNIFWIKLPKKYFI